MPLEILEVHFDCAGSQIWWAAVGACRRTQLGDGHTEARPHGTYHSAYAYI